MDFFNFARERGEQKNRAAEYYPQDITFREEKQNGQVEAEWTNFQQDFSYLDPKNNQNLEENPEKIAKNNKKSEKNGVFSQNVNQSQNFSSLETEKSENFDNSQQKNDNPNAFQGNFGENSDKNNQNSTSKLENLLKLLNNSSSSDLLGTALKSGMFGNQNPVLAQALSKILTPKDKPAPAPKRTLSPSDYFEDL